MAFSFSSKVGKVLAFLQSLGSEFQFLAPLYAKLFCPNFVFILGGLGFNLELRSILFVTADMLLKRLDKYVGACRLLTYHFSYTRQSLYSLNIVYFAVSEPRIILQLFSNAKDVASPDNQWNVLNSLLLSYFFMK